MRSELPSEMMASSTRIHTFGLSSFWTAGDLIKTNLGEAKLNQYLSYQFKAVHPSQTTISFIAISFNIDVVNSIGYLLMGMNESQRQSSETILAGSC